MAVQARTNLTNHPFVLYGLPFGRIGTILQDAGRTAILLQYTVMAKIVATGKYVPFTDETLLTGAGLPIGIYMGDDIAIADLVAGDISDASVMTGSNITINASLLVFDEGTKDLDTILNTGTVEARTVKDQLAILGINTEDTIALSGFENA